MFYDNIECSQRGQIGKMYMRLFILCYLIYLLNLREWSASKY
jgi:hypothetical protein